MILTWSPLNFQSKDAQYAIYFIKTQKPSNSIKFG